MGRIRRAVIRSRRTLAEAERGLAFFVLLRLHLHVSMLVLTSTCAFRLLHMIIGIAEHLRPLRALAHWTLLVAIVGACAFPGPK